jgi:Holliday junction resolvase
MSNRKLGNSFEAELCEILFENGFWVHNLAQNQAGQPADIIAARNKVAYLIDCKVCSGNGFPLSRVEENQDLSMSLWKDCGNGEGWFAMKLAGQIYMIPHFTVMAFGKASMTAKDIFECGKPLDKWLKRCK